MRFYLSACYVDCRRCLWSTLYVVEYLDEIRGLSMRFQYSPIEEAIARGETKVNYDAPVAECVEHGIEFLERNRLLEWAEISPDALKMDTCEECICGWLFGDFHVYQGLIIVDFGDHFVKANQLCCYLGFFKINGDYTELQTEWVRRLRLAQLKAKEVTHV